MNRGRAAYPGAVVRRAIEHYEAGWGSPAIVSMLEREFGVRPSRDTVLRWARPDVSTRSLSRNRRRNARAHRRRTTYSPEWRAERMRELFLAGLPERHIAVVARVWWGEKLSKAEVMDVIWSLTTDEDAP